LRWFRTASARQQAALAGGLALFLVFLWAMFVSLTDYPSYILPGPGEVARKALSVARDGTIWRHARVTLVEVIAGLGIGLIAAVSIGYPLAKLEWLERVLSPYIVASQSIPIVALAPLLVIWFGFGLTSKILVCALIVFFPMMVSTIVGIRSVPRDLMDLMHVLRATRWQTFTMLEVPAALPVLLGGLRLSATLSVVGAVVGEFVGADAGLGFLVNFGKGIFDTPLMFVALGCLMLIAMTLYFAILAIERRLLSWR